MQVRYAIRWSRVPETMALCASALALVLTAAGVI